MKPIKPKGPGQLVVYGKGQPEVQELVARIHDGVVRTRWTLTMAERIEIMGGRDIELDIVTQGRPLQPVSLGLVEDG